MPALVGSERDVGRGPDTLAGAGRHSAFPEEGDDRAGVSGLRSSSAVGGGAPGRRDGSCEGLLSAPCSRSGEHGGPAGGSCRWPRGAAGGGGARQGPRAVPTLPGRCLRRRPCVGVYAFPRTAGPGGFLQDLGCRIRTGGPWGGGAATPLRAARSMLQPETQTLLAKPGLRGQCLLAWWGTCSQQGRPGLGAAL